MAVASGDADLAFKEMEEDLSCSICFNLLTKPKVLDCQHVYCMQCLKDWVGNQPSIACPECRQSTTVPKGDLNNLKTNLRVKSMVEKYTVRFDKVRSVPICATHEGERQHFFCVTCDTTVCRDCLVIKHPRSEHEIQELKDIVKLRKKEMKKKLERVTVEVKKAENDKLRLVEIEIQIQGVQKQAEQSIDRRIKELCTLIQSKGRELKKQVRTISKHHLQKLEDETNRATERRKRLLNVCAATQTVTDTAANHIYIKQHASLVAKIEKLCSAHYEIRESNLKLCIHFKQGSDPSSTWFGTVIENDHKAHELSFDNEFGAFQKARSVAATQSGLLAVVDSKSEQVVVYRDDHGEYKRQFHLGADLSDDPNGTLTKPLKVAVTADDKFLVIDDGQVKMFSGTGRYEHTLSIDGDRITTTPDNMIVVANSRRGNIKVYTSNGELLKTHTIDSKNVADIASNGKQIAYTTGNEGKVCMIDFESGQELWALDTTWPLGVSFDPKSDNILVAGHAKKRGHNVIKQYCGRCGHFISSRIRHLPNGLWNPYAMSITHDGMILAVADLKTVKVLKLK